MKEFFPRIFRTVVLCQIIFSAHAGNSQTTDSAKTFVFTAKNNTPEIKKNESSLEGIATIGIGSYSGFHDDGEYETIIQPNIGFDFLADPGGPLHLLLGAQIGFLKSLTTSVSFCLRAPISEPKPDLRLFGDLGVLFFDGPFIDPIKYGARLAFGARTMGSIDMEYRLSFEWRGIASDSVDNFRSRVLWWVGAEAGIAFSLINHHIQISRKDSIHEALHYIASGEEMDELDEVTSDAKIDQWLDRFWRIRDLTPNSPTNEYRKEYENRVETANRMFSRSKVLGISTDPGRVMAIYGLPENEKKGSSIYDNRDQYMLWSYSGRVRGFSFAVFLFKKTNKDLDWIQVYSNVAGEITGDVPADLPDSMLGWMGL